MKKLVLLGMVLAICHISFAQKVGYKDKKVDFTAYKTFNFMEVNFEDGVLTQQRQKVIGILKSGISQELEKKGIKFSPEPDLEINVLIVIEDRVITRETDYTDVRRGAGTRTGVNYSWEADEIIVRQYKKGTATIDFVDNKENKMIWQGIIEETRDEGQAAEKVEKSFKKDISKLMKKYPVK